MSVSKQEILGRTIEKEDLIKENLEEGDFIGLICEDFSNLSRSDLVGKVYRIEDKLEETTLICETIIKGEINDNGWSPSYQSENLTPVIKGKSSGFLRGRQFEETGSIYYLKTERDSKVAKKSVLNYLQRYS